MEQNKSKILWIVIVLSLIVGATLSQLFTPQLISTITDTSKHKKSIDSLTNVITNLQTQQHTYDSAILNYKAQLNSLDSLNKVTKQQINKIKYQYEAKIKAANNYTPNQLDSFFAKRYGI